jgi:uncharacterized tellurite resistance protein B-like protein
MIDRILKLLTGEDVLSSSAPPDSLQVAVAALLVEAARMDDRFEEPERRTIERLLMERFDLPPETAGTLLRSAEAEVARSTQLFPFTSLAVKRLDEDERIRVIEMLWEVAYADGVLDPQEDMLVRRIAGLIHVPDRARGEARLRALARTGKTG